MKYEPTVTVDVDSIYVTFDGEATSTWITVDDLFSINIIRTDEGIVIDVWPATGMDIQDPVATAYAFDNEVKDEEDPREVQGE